MRSLRRHPARVLLVVGTLFAAQSVLWEWVRMRPDYRFLVEPWALRGFRLTQGRVVLVLALGILLIAILSWLPQVRKLGTRGGYIVGAGVILGASLVTAVSVSESRDIKLNDIGGIGISLGVGLVVALLFRDFVARRLGGRWRHSTVPVLVVVFLLVYLLFARPALVDESITIGVWMVVAVGLALAFIPAVTSPPAELGLDRILILSVAASWFVHAVSAGAARSTLIRLQFEAAGTSAQYKDAQITSGMILAFVGFVLAFIGAVALWAQRRDQLAAQQRARQQRAAAEDSLAQISA